MLVCHITLTAVAMLHNEICRCWMNVAARHLLKIHLFMKVWDQVVYRLHGALQLGPCDMELILGDFLALLATKKTQRLSRAPFE